MSPSSFFKSIFQFKNNLNIMVEYIQYREDKLPIKIGFYALKHFQKETKKSLTDLEGELSFEDIEALFYHAYINGCKALQSVTFKPKYKREDVENILDDNYLEFIQLIPKFFPKQGKKK